MADSIRNEFASLRVPVYLASNGNTSIEHTGLAKEDAARILLEVIARHNEVSGAPKLYFGGFVDSPFALTSPFTLTPVDYWTRGITVHSYECGLLEQMGDVHKALLCNADTSDARACATHLENANFEWLGVVAMVPGECGLTGTWIEWSLDGATDHDPATTLQHELGHVLGLRHTNRTEGECSMGGNMHGNDPAGNTGVMRTTNSGNLPLYRHWRRDDLDGLDHLWSGDYPDFELLYWDDDNFPDAPAIAEPASVAGTKVIRSATFADVPSGEPQPFVTLDRDRRVVFGALAGDGSVVEPPAIVDPGPLGVSAGSPTVAFGSDGVDERVLVVWTAAESSTNEQMHARWAVRDASGGAWSFAGDFLTLHTSRVVAGFDPGTTSWLVVRLSLTADLRLAIIDFDGALASADVTLSEMKAYEIGNPICGHASPACTMLVSDTVIGGPNLGRIDFSIMGDLSTAALDSVAVFESQDVYGRTSLAAAAPGVLRGIAGWHRFELGVELEAMPAPTPQPLTALRDWPLGLGSYEVGQAVPTQRMVMPLEVECGNGVVQASEQCDDGNVIPGDGCDGVCEVEPDDPDDGGLETGTGTGTETETGAAGGPVVDDGCHCAAKAHERRLASLVVLGLLAPLRWRRRRRRRRRRRKHGTRPDDGGHCRSE